MSEMSHPLAHTECRTLKLFLVKYSYLYWCDRRQFWTLSPSGCPSGPRWKSPLRSATKVNINFDGRGRMKKWRENVRHWSKCAAGERIKLKAFLICLLKSIPCDGCWRNWKLLSTFDGARSAERLPVYRTNCRANSESIFVCRQQEALTVRTNAAATKTCSSHFSPILLCCEKPCTIRGRCALRHNVMSFAQLLKFIQLQWNAITMARRCVLDTRRTLSQTIREVASKREKCNNFAFFLLRRDAPDAVPASNSNQVPFFIEQVSFELRLTGKTWNNLSSSNCFPFFSFAIN